MAAVRILLDRIWRELLGGEYIEILTPIRQPRTRLVQREHLVRACDLALLKLGERRVPAYPAMILVLIDANSDPPCVLGPQLLGCLQEARSHANVACVIAYVEYETWFVAAADSLRDFLKVDPAAGIPARPEDARSGKGWIQRHFRGHNYSETVDQPSMSATMDLNLCRERSPSFDKLCRELEARRDAGG